MARFAIGEAAHLERWSRASWANSLFEHSNRWWMLSESAMEAALSISERSPNPHVHLALATLTSRWLSHQRSVWILASHGRYGDATALVRMLYETSDLITYLGMRPDEAESWRLESKGGGPPSRRWTPAQLRRNLEELED